MHKMGDFNQENEFRRLYQQFLSNELPEEQLNVFLEQLSDENKQELIATLMTGTWQETKPVSIAPLYDTEWNIPHKSRRWWPLSMAAAAVVALLVAGFWFYREAPKSAISDQQISKSTNKAVLVLADGQRIVLDSVANGALAQQGGMQITKQADGTLLYEPMAAIQSNAPVGYNTLTTPRGGQFAIVLPDGSKAWLNSVSSLTYPTAFTGKNREVTLTGEGYFEVAENAAQPFKVNNEKIDITVLGTAFDMMCYADESIAKATLVNGAVQAGKQSELVQLAPGRQVQVHANKKWKVVAADLEEVLAWKNGLFRLKNTDVAAIMRQISRWYDVEVQYRGKVPDKNLLGYLSREEGLDKMITILASQGVHCTLENRKLIVE